MPNRGFLVGLAAALALGGVYTARSPDPFVADPAARAALRSSITLRQARADEELERLRSTLARALDEGRRGAALTVQGTRRPGSHLAAAAEQIADADRLVANANSTLQLLAGDLRIARQSATPLDAPVKSGELAGIGAQLRTAADAADAFWSMRRATEATLASLSEAFAAVDARDSGKALAAIDAAEKTLDQARNWPGSLQTLPIWTATTADLLAALRALALAIGDENAAAARAAEARYRVVAARAHRADVALALAISEGGSSVSEAPLAAAAVALRGVQAAVEEVRSILA